ncbi:MAG: hypothetical protein JKY46_11715 [Robiginitomaculum sp.]|nr:hypothetical protein [Robiginitomaculum sp.]
MIFPFFAGLILLPAAIGSFTTLLFDPYLKHSLGKSIGFTFAVMGVAVLLTVIFFAEGFICIIMAIPFFVPASMGSVWLTRTALSPFQPENKTKHVARSVAFILPLLMLPIDGLLNNESETISVTTNFTINAPKELVWQHTTSIAEIKPEERVWSISHNLVRVPMPIDAKMQGSGIGAVRHLRWTNNLNFREVITNWEENSKLSWNFEFDQDSIPATVEAHIDVKSNYLDLSNGEYELIAIDQNTTLLRLTTTYKITTPINSYNRWWGNLFLEDFHNGVLSVIKNRSETHFQAITS